MRVTAATRPATTCPATGIASSLFSLTIIDRVEQCSRHRQHLSIRHDFNGWASLISHHYQEASIHDAVLEGRNVLTSPLHRLEAATSRLEDLAALGSNAAQPQVSTSVHAQSAEPTPVPPPPPPPPPAPVVEDPPSFVAYNEAIIDGKLKPFLELTRSFASESVIEQVRRDGVAFFKLSL